MLRMVLEQCPRPGFLFPARKPADRCGWFIFFIDSIGGSTSRRARL
jgi:hypothetical protein